MGDPDKLTEQDAGSVLNKMMTEVAVLNMLGLDRDHPLAKACLEVSSSSVRRAQVMRNSMTGLEKHLWKIIGKKDNPWFFIPQVPVGPYILDFFSPKHRVALEVDGPVHLDTRVHDKERDAYFRGLGVETIRLTPRDFVKYGQAEILQYIDDFTSSVAEQRGNE